MWTQLTWKTPSVIRNKYHIDGKTLTTFDELYNQRVALSALAAFIENKLTEIRFKAVDSDPDNLEITIPYTMTVKIGVSHVGIVALLDGVKNSELESDYQVTNVDIIEYLTFVDSILTKELLKEVTDNALRLRADKNWNLQTLVLWHVFYYKFEAFSVYLFKYLDVFIMLNLCL